MKKKILNLSYDDYTGAGLASLRFHKNLLENNYSSYLMVNEKKSNYKNIININKKSNIDFFLNKFEFLFLKKRNKYAFYNKNRYLINDLNQIPFIEKIKPQIVIFHWVTNFINPSLLYQIKKKYKSDIYCNLIDIAPLTGGCHINWGCTNFSNDCGNCPAVSFIYKKKPVNTLSYKLNIFSNLNIKFLYTCEWMKDQLKKSAIAKSKKVFKLMLPIDENVFKPENKVIKKNPWNIKKDKRIILFRSSHHLRKGNDILINSIKYLIQENQSIKKKFLLISIGDNYASLKLKNLNVNYLNLGKIESEKKLSQLYKITDLLISPSIDDVGPMMINEAVISGVPVISFNIGVAKDLINNNINGYIVNKINYKNLSNYFKKFLFLKNTELKKMKKNSRKIGLKKSSFKSHITNFKKIIDN